MSNSRSCNQAFFHTHKENIDMCAYVISVVYICRIISCLKGFALVYHIPHIWNAYVAEVFLEIINAKNEACL